MVNKTNLFLSLSAVVISSLCFGMEQLQVTDSPETITIETSDNKRINISQDLYQQSGTIMNALRDCKEYLTVIQLPNISEYQMRSLCALSRFVPGNQSNKNENLYNLGMVLCTKTLLELSSLLKAVNYLNIEWLPNFVTAFIAKKLCRQDNKNAFIESPNFLANIGLNYYVHDQSQPCLPGELSILVAQRILEDYTIKEYLVYNSRISCPVVQENSERKLWVLGDYLVSEPKDNNTIVWNRTQFNDVTHYLEHLPIEDAMFFVYVCDSIKQNQKFDISSTHLKDIYESLPQSIRGILDEHKKIN